MEPRSSHTTPPEDVPSRPEGRLRTYPDLLVADRRWRAALPRLDRLVPRCVEATWPWLDRDRLPAILLTTDRAVQSLNAAFRDRNKPTNVLTFEEMDGFGDGDIALAYETVRREAQAAGRRFGDHAAHLLVHGALHLAGYDHHRPDEARQMEMTESRILARLGIPNPWRLGGGKRG